ncbi:M20 family metallopeptidase [Consotaella aegiceratis]|uniref:M20 family metallopeptidase n=1 Tax=Consotaella aegiceratis TaxID=3097961 RepID=UPI002F3E78C2
MAWVGERGDEAVRDLGRMVALDTSFPPGRGYAAFSDLMEEMVSPLRLATRRVSVPAELCRVPGGTASGERVNLLASAETGRPPCGLYFHVDTVPVAPGWQRDPFSLIREGDRLYGLGAADMKGTIAAALLALRAAAKCGVELAYDPVLLFCSDEEGGLYPGVRYLAEQGLLPPHILNFNGSAAPRVWAGCFGLFNLLVRFRGHGVHAGEGNRTGAGVNAIEHAVPFLAALTKLKQAIAERGSALPAPPHATGPLRPQLAVAAAHGGTAGGQVPALFEVILNRRYAPEERFEDALAEIMECLDRSVAPYPGLEVETHLVGHLCPTSDPDGPHWPRWQKALGAGFGYRPEDFQKWGAASCSDFGWVQRAGVTQEVLLGGLGRPESCIHSPEEHTTVGDIIALARSILSYLAADFESALIPERIHQ